MDERLTHGAGGEALVQLGQPLLHSRGTDAAKRHVLQALEEAPRFRDAHKLLLEITGSSQSNAEKTPEQPKNP